MNKREKSRRDSMLIIMWISIGFMCLVFDYVVFYFMLRGIKEVVRFFVWMM